MDKIAYVKSQLCLQKWAKIISDCQANDMTVAAWCEANNINIKSYYWLRKVRNHTLEQMPELTENLPAPIEDAPVTFKRLDVQTPVTGTAAAENAIRPFTVGRKNWLFADMPKGADASAAIYSIIETAKAHGLNIYTYLEYLLMYIIQTNIWKTSCHGISPGRMQMITLGG